MIGTLLDTEDGSGSDLGRQTGIGVPYGNAPFLFREPLVTTAPAHKEEKAGPGSWMGKGRYFPLGPLDPRKDFATFIPVTAGGQSVQPVGR